MDIYCTIEERYIQAVEELRYGETAKALRLFNDLLATDPSYARIYFQVGIINYYYINDYQAAGWYFSKCLELDPQFPDVYQDFIKLLVFLNMEQKAKQIASKALQVAGINKFIIYQQIGLLEEQNQNWNKSLECYKQGLVFAFEKDDLEDAKQAIERINLKAQRNAKYVYCL